MGRAACEKCQSPHAPETPCPVRSPEQADPRPTRPERRGHLEAASQAPDPNIGRLIGGKYRLERHIAAGGMGSVYEGVQVELGRRVAVKLMDAKLAVHGELLERFRIEASRTAQIE